MGNVVANPFESGHPGYSRCRLLQAMVRSRGTQLIGKTKNYFTKDDLFICELTSSNLFLK